METLSKTHEGANDKFYENDIDDEESGVDGHRSMLGIMCVNQGTHVCGVHKNVVLTLLRPVPFRDIFCRFQKAKHLK